MQQHLAAELSKQLQPEVHIRGDRKVEHEHVMKVMIVMASVQRAGILKLEFASEQGQ